MKKLSFILMMALVLPSMAWAQSFNSYPNVTNLTATGEFQVYDPAYTASSVNGVSTKLKNWTPSKLVIDSTTLATPSEDALVFYDFSAGAYKVLTPGTGINIAGTVISSPDQTSVSGNAGSASVLQTPRTINGVSFNGSANITVPAAAGTITGTTLAANVTDSSLTSVGTLATLTVTAPINGSVTGNAATVTTNANMTGEVTSVGNAATLLNSAVIGKVLTAFTAGAGTVTSSDSILTALQKVVGNIALKANSASPTFTGTVTLPAGTVVNGVTLQTGGSSSQFLNAAGAYSTPAGGGGTGDFSGPASSTDNALVVFDGTGGKTGKNSTLLYSSGNLSGMTEVTVPNTGLHILDTNASHDVIIAAGSNVTADRTLTVVTGDANRSLTLSGDTTLSGTNTGDQTTITGNAGTATALQTARTINGTSFDGTANITVTAAPSGAAGGDLAGTYPNPTIGATTVTGKLLTGYTSGAGTVAATDTILQGIQKLNGNDALKAPLASPTFTGTVTLPTSQINTGMAKATAGVLGVATAGTDYVAPGTATVYTAQQNFGAQSLTDATNIAWNLATQQIATVTLAGNRTLSAPTNLVNGGTYLLQIKQDATGGRTLAYNSVYRFPGGTDPVLSTGANAVDILTCTSDGTNMNCVMQLNFQ